MNRALVHLRSSPDFSGLKLALSDRLEDLKALGHGQGAESRFTEPDIRPPISKAWAGASLSAIETFVEAVRHIESIEPDLYLVVDEEGLGGKTCIVAQRIYGREDKPSGGCEARWPGIHDYNRVRMPWDRTMTMFDNLSIGNMGFEDYIEYNFDKDVDVDSRTADGQGR
ncbi:GroES-like protein [Apiospora phragmitis]|uniref:GroES-like protein n=1 Tax=Apiospora phragmitis TaxID=2905665 RepID=A0ABR1TT51_9PEZI